MSYLKISDGGLLMTVIPGLRTKLYVGTDHLLLVEQLILVERYKRFYFRDIEVITATPSARWIVFGVLWASFAFLAALSFFIHQPLVIGAGIFFTALFGFAFVHNMILGPTCIVRVETAVQSHRVAPLERIREFRQRMETIESLIRQSQLPIAPRLNPPGIPNFQPQNGTHFSKMFDSCGSASRRPLSGMRQLLLPGMYHRA
jgi:hypothetical protein